MTDEAPSPNMKRRRLSAVDSSPKGIIRLADLPSGILAHAATFLAKPFKFLFVIALNENSPSERSLAILGNQWDVLDFEGMEKELAAKLSDDDIEKGLLCIDAVNNVKRLRLTNCTNITGTGLEPLRGSTVIEQIDLGLVPYHKSPVLDPAPPISFEDVMPIIDSIITQEGCQLKHIEFPQKWHDLSDSDSPRFYRRFYRMWNNRTEFTCLNEDCNERVDVDELCCKCLNHYCSYCETEDGERMLSYCSTCEKSYCFECVGAIDHCSCCPQEALESCCRGLDCAKSFRDCSLCAIGFGKICVDCDTEERQCHQCKDAWCNDCLGDESRKCAGCNVRLCFDCDEDFQDCDPDPRLPDPRLPNLGCPKTFCSDCVSNSKCCSKCNKCDKLWCEDCGKDNSDCRYRIDHHPNIGHCDGCDCNVCYNCTDYWRSCETCKGSYCDKCWEIESEVERSLHVRDCCGCRKTIYFEHGRCQLRNVCDDCYKCGFPDDGCPGCIRNAEKKRLNRLRHGNSRRSLT